MWDLIKGEFRVSVNVPEPVNEKVEVHGLFEVNSREELMGYLEEAIDVIERRGRELLLNK